MNEIPWYFLSPNPITITTYILMALYGSWKMKPLNKRDWFFNFLDNVFIVGLIVLPWDLLWTVNQALVFGHLYPNDLAELFPLFTLKVLCLFLCWHETYKFFKEKGPLELKNLFYMVVYVLYLFIQFKLASGPEWTDFTYAYRFEYSNWPFGLFLYVVKNILHFLVFASIWKRDYRK